VFDNAEHAILPSGRINYRGLKSFIASANGPVVTTNQGLMLKTFYLHKLQMIIIS